MQRRGKQRGGKQRGGKQRGAESCCLRPEHGRQRRVPSGSGIGSGSGSGPSGPRLCMRLAAWKEGGEDRSALSRQVGVLVGQVLPRRSWSSADVGDGMENSDTCTRLPVIQTLSMRMAPGRQANKQPELLSSSGERNCERDSLFFGRVRRLHMTRMCASSSR